MSAARPPTIGAVETATVPERLAGARLDAAAARLFADYSRSRLQAWIEAGRLDVNGLAVLRARQPVNAGDELRLRAEVEVSQAAVAQNLSLDVVHEDADLAVIHKPAGLTTHPGAGQHDATLQNGLLHRFPQTAGLPRAGIVHRLDKDTSGLLVVALSLPAHTRLVSLIARRDIRREYDAIVNGDVVAGGTIDEPIGRHPRDRLKKAVVSDGRKAVTHYRVQEKFSFHTHLRVRLETGRTHQIRVHLAHRRHAIVGDALYGGRIARGAGLSAELRATLLSFPRQALHARELAFAHPRSGEALSFCVEPPRDMQELLARLRAG